MHSKGNLALGSGKGCGGRVGRSPAVDSWMVWDGSLEILHAPLMYLVAATRIPGHHAASRNCGRRGAGAAEGPASEGKYHPEPGYCGADHQHGAVQPPGPEKA